MQITLGIADDHVLVAEAMRSAFGTAYDIVGIVHNGAEVIPFVERCHPDVLLLDPMLAGPNGIDMIKALRDLFPAVHIVVLSKDAQALVAHSALRRGASAVVPATAHLEELRRAIDEAAAGRSVPPTNPNDDSTSHLAMSRAGFSTLTPREQAIVLLIGRGMSNGQIAQSVGISARTVHFHRSNVRRKLRLCKDFELHRFALLAAMIEEQAATIRKSLEEQPPDGATSWSGG